MTDKLTRIRELADQAIADSEKFDAMRDNHKATIEITRAIFAKAVLAILNESEPAPVTTIPTLRLDEGLTVNALASKARSLVEGMHERVNRAPDFADFAAAFAPILKLAALRESEPAGAGPDELLEIAARPVGALDGPLGTCRTKYGESLHIKLPDCKGWKPAQPEGSKG